MKLTADQPLTKRPQPRQQPLQPLLVMVTNERKNSYIIYDVTIIVTSCDVYILYTVAHKIHSKLLILIYMVDRHLWLMLKAINNLISIANSNNYSVFICTKNMRKHVFISLLFYLKIIKNVEQFVNLLM